MQVLAFDSCFQIMCERDNGKRIVQHLEGLFTQMPLPVALDSHLEKALRDIRQ